MKRSDDVFFFTLIDFLLQVFFFGLLLYVFAQSNQNELEKIRRQDDEVIEKLKIVSGFSNLTELTDILTNLAPMKELKGTSDFIRKAGGLDKVTLAVNTVESVGGTEAVAQRLEKLRKLEEGSGKPPCLFSLAGDKKQAKSLATVIATDSTIIFQENNSDLEDTLRQIGRSFESVRELPLAQFRQVFASLLSKRPECRYTLRFREHTSLVHARDAARFSFYLMIENAR
jgi:hypothetical protein